MTNKPWTLVKSDTTFDLMVTSELVYEVILFLTTAPGLPTCPDSPGFP